MNDKPGRMTMSMFVTSELFPCVNCGYPAYTQEEVKKEVASLQCPRCKNKVAEKGISTKCGCGRHFVTINGKDVVNYNGEFWQLTCLSIKIDKRMPKLLRLLDEKDRQIKAYRKMRLKFIRMKKFIRKMPCSHCGHNVGNRFKEIGDGLFCGICGQEMQRSLTT
jgi:transcription elongation factor Elf1